MKPADGPVRTHATVPRPRKRFGQHFLHDPSVLERILAALAPRAGDALAEIGPGRGALTTLLLRSQCRSLDAIEIDRELSALLRERFAGESRFTLHEADALAFDFAGLAAARGGRLRVVGNLPYNISTPLLFHLLEHAPAIVDLHVMLQREVIARMAAKPAQAAYGRLSVMLYPRVQVEPLFEIGPGAFRPPPRVWSALARLSIRSEPCFRVHPLYGTVVAAAFAQRRKTLRNALRGLVTAEQIVQCGLDPTARAQTVAPEDFNALAQLCQAPD